MNHEFTKQRYFLYRNIVGLIFVFFLYVFLSSISPLKAQTPTDTPTPTSSNQNTINELKKKITELQGTEKSLSTEINLVDSQINVTELRIEGIISAISKISTEINELAGEIVRIESILTRRSELVIRRIPESYKRSQVPLFGSLFLSDNFSDLLHRIKYIGNVQEDDAQLLFQLKATQNNFSERKDLRESKKLQQEKLRIELEKESKELELKRKQKKQLLDQTKNSEAVYQQLLTQALAESQALERALVEGVKVGPIKRGDPIALYGNSGYPGCSTGAHLHLETRKNGIWVNPGTFLENKTIKDADGGTATIGSGNWMWPLEGDVVLTQHFGHTPYSWRYRYSGGIHTGLDLVSRTSSVIRAPADGTLFSSSQSCGSSSIIKIKYIEHNDGVVSFYLHVQ